MKSLILVSSSLVATSFASLQSLHSNILSLARSQNNTGRKTDRAFAGFVANSFTEINGYGCWCYLDDTWRDASNQLINRPSILAHGQVVDAIDESCRDLINAYKCIEMDAEEAGDFDCDAQSVSYTPYNFFSSETDLDIECNAENTGVCAIGACLAEGAFTLKYLELGFVGINPDSFTTHDDYNADHVHNTNGGTFDPSVECPGIPNPVGSDKQCCGNYVELTRKPFRLYSGFTTRSCCSGEVINNELQQCCNDSVLDINELCV